MTKHYLAHNQVLRKNTTQKTFVTSQKVFMDLLQTPVQIGLLLSPSAQAAMTHNSLRKQFDCISQWCSQMHKEMREAREAKRSESTGTKTRRHKSSQTFNRYRTIDHPAPHQAQTAGEMNPAQPRTKPRNTDRDILSNSALDSRSMNRLKQ
ncbi:hypothetical protein BC939DRAFT_206592 [Gamsiella multidivaricata]|uniref:uncharacterized protein n=1 Tax=Gamsiella multidivaricata TaxID=101098 RepID=UPI0022208513|nr:uncharacterized protein BC939DRAFT_206592 [Gamsiella multidivaricata]KAI7821590.1 hypothetical protein BC939DRAFT_206592 [Gamsiella multidivaricata]